MAAIKKEIDDQTVQLTFSDAIKKEIDHIDAESSLLSENKIYVEDGIGNFGNPESRHSNLNEILPPHKVSIPSCVMVKKEEEFQSEEFVDLNSEYENVSNFETFPVKNECVQPDRVFMNTKESEAFSIYNSSFPGPSHSQDQPELLIQARRNSAEISSSTNSKEKRFTCEYCQKSFSERYILKKHLRFVHCGEKLHLCQYCNKSFAQKFSLKRHLLIHFGVKAFSCEQCNKNFTEKSDLKVHLLTHSGEKPHACEFCGKSFSQKSNLKKHILVHTGVKAFTCEQCNKSFAQAYHLKDHLLIHSGIKAFSCDYCNKSFTHKSDLKKHLLVHSGAKPFTCEYCSRSFSQNSSLRRHLRTHSSVNKQTSGTPPTM